MSGLSSEERGALVETGDHAPWHYTEFGVLCSCGLPIIDADRDYCQTLVNLEATVDQIANARVKAALEAAADAITNAPPAPIDGPFLSRSNAASIVRDLSPP